MGVSACTRCSKCGSDLAQGPTGHAEKPAEHDFVTKYNQDTGEPFQICRNCLRTQKQLEKEEAKPS
jgi:hypothetical protein